MTMAKETYRETSVSRKTYQEERLIKEIRLLNVNSQTSNKVVNTKSCTTTHKSISSTSGLIASFLHNYSKLRRLQKNMDMVQIIKTSVQQMPSGA